jgi:hypothetical protein
MSTTEDPLHATQVLAVPLFTSRSPSPAAQSVSHLPLVFVAEFPHCVEWALKFLAGKAPFDTFTDIVQKVPERGQAAVGGDVDRHHRYSYPFDRDVAVATVK